MLNDFAASLRYFEQTLERNPDDLSALYDYGKLKAECCDWSARNDDEKRIFEQTDRYLNVDTEYGLSLAWVLQIFDTPSDLHARVVRRQAELITRRMAPVKTACRFRHSKTTPEKLRIGYVSPDFRAHAVGTLIYDLFRHHDRSRVEVYGYGLVIVEDQFLSGVRKGCDVFVDLSNMSPEQMARRIHQDGIHVLIDMAGHTAHRRPEVFALEPAPVQAHYLGYLDIMGADFLPYILADPIVIPPEARPYYNENIVYLPDSFAVASPLDIAETPVSRKDIGLPEDAPVFCCFNNTYKIEPRVFDVWMRILRRTPGSVLWLARSNELNLEYLRREAERRDIAGDRIVESPRLDLPNHIARARLTDLFLDTFIYNAGSTAFNILWAGVPILTKPENRYLARMGASLMRSAGLPELVCETVEEYEEKAVRLVSHPEELRTLRERLTTQRDRLPLFDLPCFARHLEDAYTRMWEQHVTGVREDVWVGKNDE